MTVVTLGLEAGAQVAYKDYEFVRLFDRTVGVYSSGLLVHVGATLREALRWVQSQ